MKPVSIGPKWDSGISIHLAVEQLIDFDKKEMCLPLIFRVSRLTKRTGTDRNGVTKRTSMGTGTDFSGYQNGPEQTSAHTEKRTSMGTRKGRVGYDRYDPTKNMYVLVGR